MAQPAPQLAGTPTPNQTVNIASGIPSQSSVTIPSQGVVQFSADGSNYLIQMWDKKNEKHSSVCFYLPANSSIYVVGGPETDDQNTVCPYSVLSTSGQAYGGITGTGGGNKIVIGSGNDEDND